MLLNCGVGETIESPLDCREIQPVHPKGNQSWIFIGRTDAKAEIPILWPPHVKSWFIGKDPDAGRDWGQEEKGMTEDEMVEWHLWLDGHEFEQSPGVGNGQGSLMCYSPWGHKKSDTTEWLAHLVPPTPFCENTFISSLNGLTLLLQIIWLYTWGLISQLSVGLYVCFYAGTTLFWFL